MDDSGDDMAQHSAADSDHSGSQTYGGDRRTIDQARLGAKLKAEGKITGDIPKGKPLSNGKG